MSEYEGQGDEPQPEGIPARFYTPDDQEAGVYAQAVAVWHTPYDFVIDFGSIQVAQPIDVEDPDRGVEIPIRVVSRVRIPTGVVFDLIRTINARMEVYEQEWGEIQRPEPREQGGGEA